MCVYLFLTATFRDCCVCPGSMVVNPCAHHLWNICGEATWFKPIILSFYSPDALACSNTLNDTCCLKGRAQSLAQSSTVTAQVYRPCFPLGSSVYRKGQQLAQALRLGQPMQELITTPKDFFDSSSLAWCILSFSVISPQRGIHRLSKESPNRHNTSIWAKVLLGALGEPWAKLLIAHTRIW